MHENSRDYRYPDFEYLSFLERIRLIQRKLMEVSHLLSEKIETINIKIFFLDISLPEENETSEQLSELILKREKMIEERSKRVKQMALVKKYYEEITLLLISIKN